MGSKLGFGMHNPVYLFSKNTTACTMGTFQCCLYISAWHDMLLQVREFVDGRLLCGHKHGQL